MGDHIIVGLEKQPRLNILMLLRHRREHFAKRAVEDRRGFPALLIQMIKSDGNSVGYRARQDQSDEL